MGPNQGQTRALKERGNTERCLDFWEGSPILLQKSDRRLLTVMGGNQDDIASEQDDEYQQEVLLQKMILHCKTHIHFRV